MSKVQYPPLYVGTFAMLLTAIGAVYSGLPDESWMILISIWALLYGAGLWCGRLHARHERNGFKIASYLTLAFGCLIVFRVWTTARWDTNFLYLLMFIQGARNFTLSNRREFHFAHVISLMLILHVAANETRSSFLFYLVVYSLAGAFTLMADHVDAKLAEAQGGDKELLSKGISLPAKGISLGLTVMLVAGFVYLFTPRPPSPSMQVVPSGTAPKGVAGPYNNPGEGIPKDPVRPNPDGSQPKGLAGYGTESGNGTGGLASYQRARPRSDDGSRQQSPGGGQSGDGHTGGGQAGGGQAARSANGELQGPAGSQGDQTRDQSPYFGFKNKFDVTKTCKMDSNRVVFYLQSDRPAYARARTFDTFDGKSWSDSGQEKSRIQSEGGFFYLQQSYGRKDLPWESVAQVYILKTDWEGTIFHHYRAENVAFPSPFIEAGADDTIEVPGIILKETRYSVLSQLQYVEGRVCSSGRRDAPDKNYTRLPDGMSRRTMELARSLTEGKDDLEAAKSIEGHLRSAYSFSNEVPDESGAGSPVEEFLFSKKKGNPEMFATSMVLMLRSRHIPARLVVGFRATRYNPILGRYDARILDAHSWVEAYIRDYGWVTFEPTPGFELPAKRRDLLAFTSIFRYTKDRLDWITKNNAHSWWSKMITFLRTFYSHIKERLQRLLHGVWNSMVSLWIGLSIQGVIFLIALAVVYACLYVFKRVFRSSWGRLHVEYTRRFKPKDLLFVCYRETEEALARSGEKREAWCSPSEYAGQVNERFPQIADDFLKLTSLVNRAVYGHDQAVQYPQEAYEAYRAIFEKRAIRRQ